MNKKYNLNIYFFKKKQISRLISTSYFGINKFFLWSRILKRNLYRLYDRVQILGVSNSALRNHLIISELIKMSIEINIDNHN